MYRDENVEGSLGYPLGVLLFLSRVASFKDLQLQDWSTEEDHQGQDFVIVCMPLQIGSEGAIHK